MTKSKQKLALIAAALAYVCWGINTPAIKIAVESMPIPLFLVTRFIIIAIIMLPFVIYFWKPMKRKDLLRQIVVSAFFATGIFLLSYGLTKTSVSHAAVLGMLNPIIMLLFAYLFLKDKVRAKSLTGILIALVGACIIVGYRSADSTEVTSSPQLLGDLAILLSVVCSVLGVITLKPLTKKYNPFQTTLVGLSIGILPMAFYLIGNPEMVSFDTITAKSFYGLLLSALTMALANILFFYALGKRKISQIIFYYYVEPVVIVVIAYLLLSEGFSLSYVIGSALVAAGLWIAETNKNRPRSLRKTATRAIRYFTPVRP